MTRTAGPRRPPAGNPASRKPPPRGAASRYPSSRYPAPARSRRRTLRLGPLHSRARVGFAAVCTLLLVIGGRLVQLQGFDHGHYSAAAQEQRLVPVALHALRGTILDRNGAPLAYTSAAQDITVDPAQIRAAQRAGYAAKLAPLVGKDEAKVEQVLAEHGHYAVLASGLDPGLAQRITDLGLVGIYSQATTQRQYPGHTTAANVLGTVHLDGTGAAGIEAQYNSVLAGKDGNLTYTIDNMGNINPSSRTVVNPARNGGTVRLTIDQSLQYITQQYLDRAVRASGARDAEAVVLDAQTAQVLAMASSGTFDAADPNTIDPNRPIDPPVMSAFEPGSVQKAITFAAALQQRIITPKSVLTVPDHISMGGVTISDAWGHQPYPYTATGILAQSSNVGTLKIAHKLGPTVWYSYERKFGVGEKTGIELPGESGGYLPPRNTWSASTFANLPFGQGESMTVLQLASIYQAIANNGVRVPPRIVQSVTQSDGTVKDTAPPAGIRVISPDTDRTLRTMLESVTLPGGTGVKAAVPGYRVAGKTGTAQQPDPNNGGRYSDWMNWDTFAGMIPADAPKFVVAIMVDNPAHGLEGGDVAAPLFHDIASYEVQHAAIPPTGSQSKHVPLVNCGSKWLPILGSTVC